MLEKRGLSLRKGDQAPGGPCLSPDCHCHGVGVLPSGGGSLQCHVPRVPCGVEATGRDALEGSLHVTPPQRALVFLSFSSPA